ncbi:hypothetical protein CBR_g12520 [Chara braunii]|uniref:CCHC-type domain-containing protein n=1 Tax=Chara braunii TaxID=69332 RepID=A0A388JST9_CHABU|nr:hypothetical protein CBR_g12520 [Chara braunii]|eukprot:GBG60782.1 hypothetical protein CBR_g12520 [Chara braunii]
MASNFNNMSGGGAKGPCYSCGQAGHLARFCPFPHRRLNGVQSSTSNAIVPVQAPLLTLPGSNGFGTAVQPYSRHSSGGGGWLGSRVSTLEEKVGKISAKHEAEEAKEQAAREEEDRRKREREEEERTQRDKREREEFLAQLNREMNSKLDRVCEVVSTKKGGDSNEVAMLKAQVEALKRSWDESGVAGTLTRNSDNEEVSRLKAQVAELMKRVQGPSSSVPTKRADEAEEIARLHSEQAEMKSAADRTFAALEDFITSLKGRCEEVEASAEVWKSEALRPGNKRGCAAIDQTPITEAQFRPRTTPVGSPQTVRRANAELKGRRRLTY